MPMKGWSMVQEWLVPGMGWVPVALRGVGADVIETETPLRPVRYDDVRSPRADPLSRLRFASRQLESDGWRLGVTATAPGPCVYPDGPVVYTTEPASWDGGVRRTSRVAVALGPDRVELSIDGALVFVSAAHDRVAGLGAAIHRAELHEQWTVSRTAQFGRGTVDGSTATPVWCAESWSSGIVGSGPPPVTVQLHLPEHCPDPARDTHWRCGFSVRGVDAGPHGPMYGYDPVGALAFALRELATIWARFPAVRVRVRVPPSPDVAWSGERASTSGASIVGVGPIRRRGGWTCEVRIDGRMYPIAGLSPIGCLLAAAPMVVSSEVV